MDIRMPVLNGFEAYEKIKVFRPELPVIAQTAYSSFEDEKIMKMGFVDCITKPLDKEKVYEVLDAFLLKFINKCSKFNLHKQFALHCLFNCAISSNFQNQICSLYVFSLIA
jgi:YesN/AraC family two-component response regulator